MRLLIVVGARPQFIKLAGLLPEFKDRFEVQVVHTGQHYDAAMSSDFFQEFALPEPDFHLGVGSASHGVQTGRMLCALDPILEATAPDQMVVLGDTNSTLAGALAASKMGIPVVHVEAGLRSFSPLPEETNRVLTDHLSSLLFAPSEGARQNLAREGITEGVHVVGDVMLDVARTVLERLPDQGRGDYAVLTLHRDINTDHPERLKAILETLAQAPMPIKFPCHPRTEKAMREAGLEAGGQIKLQPPCGYGEMLGLLRGAQLALTDSGGLQKEAYYVGTPCLTLRPTTEWNETIEAGWNRLVDADPGAIAAGLADPPRKDERPPLYGDGRSARAMADVLALQ
ncbi:MAG: non-hydrolyzing UDP-N-acetylglucosamine 2-epimerase [Vulcanimicrobiota bacterium]